MRPAPPHLFRCLMGLLILFTGRRRDPEVPGTLHDATGPTLAPEDTEGGTRRQGRSPGVTPLKSIFRHRAHLAASQVGVLHGCGGGVWTKTDLVPFSRAIPGRNGHPET